MASGFKYRSIWLSCFCSFQVTSTLHYPRNYYSFCSSATAKIKTTEYRPNYFSLPGCYQFQFLIIMCVPTATCWQPGNPDVPLQIPLYDGKAIWPKKRQPAGKPSQKLVSLEGKTSSHPPLLGTHPFFFQVTCGFHQISPVPRNWKKEQILSSRPSKCEWWSLAKLGYSMTPAHNTDHCADNQHARR